MHSMQKEFVLRIFAIAIFSLTHLVLDEGNLEVWRSCYVCEHQGVQVHVVLIAPNWKGILHYLCSSRSPIDLRTNSSTYLEGHCHPALLQLHRRRHPLGRHLPFELRFASHYWIGLHHRADLIMNSIFYCLVFHKWPRTQPKIFFYQEGCKYNTRK